MMFFEVLIEWQNWDIVQLIFNTNSEFNELQNCDDYIYDDSVLKYLLQKPS